jgi:uncharacterized protein (TIGR02118 family)
MIKLTVMYPKTEDLTFDMDYYRDSHVPMLRRLMGERLKGFSLDLAATGPNLPTPYAVIATLLFASLQEMQAGLAEHGATLASDVPNYTNARPVIQVSQAC